jgi:hypothetical protein
MKYSTSLIALTLLALALAGCSKHSQTAAFPKNNNLGVINVLDGKPSSHTLDDGRVCTITPSVLPNGNVKLTTTIIETNASGVKRSSLVFESPVNGRACTFGFDKNTVLTVTLDNKDAVLPGRHMSESQVVEIAGRELPQASGFRCEFKDGVWEILEEKNSCQFVKFVS